MKDLGITMAHDYFLVVIPTINKKTDSGIIKSDEMLREEEQNSKGSLFLTVAAVGDNVPDIKVGDEVLISQGNNPQIELEGVMYGIVHRASIYLSKKNLIGINI